MGIESKIVGMISSIAQGCKNQKSTPLPEPLLDAEGEWEDIDGEMARVKLEEGQMVNSTSVESEPEEGSRVSQVQKALVQSPSDMVEADSGYLRPIHIS